MKIIVSVKQVPSRDSALKVNSAGKWLDESDLSFEMNEPDAYALEEALQLKEKLGRRSSRPQRRSRARLPRPSAKLWRKVPTAPSTCKWKKTAHSTL